MNVDGNWVLTLNTPMGAQTAKLVLATSGGAVTGTMQSPSGDVELTEGRLDGQELSWKSKISKPVSMTLKFVLTVDGDQLSGSAKALMGKIAVTGVRG